MPLDPDKGAARDRLGILGMMFIAWRCCRCRGAEVEMLSADFLKTAQLRVMLIPTRAVVPLVNAKRRNSLSESKLDGAGYDGTYAGWSGARCDDRQ